MANTKDTNFVKVVTATSSNQREDLATTRNTITLIADGDCFINFDEAVSTTNRFLLNADTPVEFHDVMVRSINYMADTGSPKIYIAAFKRP